MSAAFLSDPHLHRQLLCIYNSAILDLTLEHQGQDSGNKGHVYIIDSLAFASRKAIGGCMNILLLSMPDSFEHMPVVAIRMPNGALTSIAGNIDSHHRVAVADLILARSNVRATVERLVAEWKPDILGLSVMTFQRKTALKIVALVRRLKPGD